LKLQPEAFIALGTLPPAEVPRALAAADVCLITSPYNEFFAYGTSPMKLFEYMFAGRAILASDLPSTREVVQHGDSAYLVPPSDVDALARALETLRNDPYLRAKLGEHAAEEAKKYTWQARAEIILGNISEKTFS
jgi:glycosyltransferase involved in cell wall biosynthesis